jgi:hypothetical protein
MSPGRSVAAAAEQVLGLRQRQAECFWLQRAALQGGDFLDDGWVALIGHICAIAQTHVSANAQA